MPRLIRFRAALVLVTLAAAALAVAACSGGGGGDTGSDEQFVADVCKAGAKFQDDLTKVFPALANAKSEEEATKLIAEPFETFARSFKAARPPADLKEWHTESSKSLEEAVTALKRGDTNAAIFQQDSPFPEPPAGASERLQAIADGNADCQKAQLFSQ